MEHILIPKDIAKDEPCIRCLLPTKVNKQKIHPDAVLPRESKTDASVLREKYTTIERCIEHGKSIDPQTHGLAGLLRFSQAIVDKVNEWAQTQEAEVENIETHEKEVSGVKAHLEYSPMKDTETYADKNVDYYTDSTDLQLPMHADLMYEEPLEKGFVRIKMRMYGSRLIRCSQKAFMNSEVLGEWD